MPVAASKPPPGFGDDVSVRSAARSARLQWFRDLLGVAREARAGRSAEPGQQLLVGNRHHAEGHVAGDRLRFYPDHVRLHHSPRSRVRIDTSEGFRTCRVEIDGEKRLEAPGAFQPRPGRNDFAPRIQYQAPAE